MNRLEDYLRLEPDSSLPPKLLKAREEFITGIGAIIDDGGISGVPLTLDEISELEYRNYPNAMIDEAPSFIIPEDDEHYVDHENEVWKEINVEFAKDVNLDIVKKLQEKHNEIFPDYLLNDPEIVGYPDAETQKEIYDWVKTKLPYNNFSVKDLGCGRGDFGNWLDYSFKYGGDEGEISPEIDYFGIDNNPNLIQVGQKKYPELKLIYSDFNDVSIQTDFTVCIGTLNDEHDLDKWMMFNKTLNHALNNTKTAILFVLQANCYGIEGHLDYPLHELVQNLSEGIRFEIDYSKLEDIYLLTVHIGGYNN